MTKVKRFEDLDVWQKAREICREIYAVTKTKPFSDDYDLARQIRKSSGSIMDNITEGFERGGNREFIQFLSIAKGSSGEARSQLYRSFDQEYLDLEKFQAINSQLEEISRMLNGFISYLINSDLKGVKYK